MQKLYFCVKSILNLEIGHASKHFDLVFGIFKRCNHALYRSTVAQLVARSLPTQMT